MYTTLVTVFSIAAVLLQTGADSVQCTNDQPVATAPHKNIWLALSTEELESVSTLLGKFNYSSPTGESSRTNYISQIELLQPNKSNALTFLDHNGEAPKRYARATIVFGDTEEPYYQQYVVGPLPLSNTTTSLTPLTFPFNNQAPGKTNVSPFFLVGPDVGLFVEQLASDIEDITKAIYDTTLMESIFPRLGSPFSIEDGKTHVWATFVGPASSGFDTLTVLPQGVFVRLDLTSRDWNDWHITGWYYLGTFYETTDDFRKLIFAAEFELPSLNLDGSWLSTDKQGDPLPLDELPPPVAVSEGSQRFAIDVDENYVSWMDFSFFMSITKDSGLSLFDIQFKGKRILYELGLQEALTHYAGSDPVASQTTYFDAQGGFGSTLVPLVKGYDCPSYATYLNATWSEGEISKTQVDAICLFEYDTGYPIRRHSSPALNYTTVTKNILFTARTVSTIGNYDFLISYEFFLDGSIEVSARASGYISAAYYAGNDEYGFQIHDSLSGSIHDHVLTFKADLDILGEKNSVQKVEFVPATVEYPWAMGRPRNTMKAMKSFITSESDSSINWAPNDAAIYAVVNKDAKNKFGEYPGYRVRRSIGTSHLTVENSTNFGKAGHFATKDLFFTQQKDSEPRATDPYNSFEFEDPLVDFAKFLDGDSLDQEDVVLWFNLGMHHIPHTGDLPNTVMTSAHSGIRIEPLNYLAGDPSIATSQQIKINVTDGTTETYGAQVANCSVDLGMLGMLV